MLNTGLVSVTFRDKTPEEIISAVKQCGLEGIEWGGDVHVLPGDVSRAREIRHLTEQAGLAVWAYGSYFEAGEQTPDLFPPVLESAKALGAPCIRVWAGTRCSAQADPEYVQRVISCTQAICDMASTAGIDICYEYHPNTLTDNCDSAVQTLRGVARDNLHLYWQPNSRLSQTENLHALRTVQPYLYHVHVFYLDSVYNRFPLVEGASIWQEYLDIIRQDGKTRSLMLEFVKDDSFEQMAQDAAALRALVREA